MWEIFKHKEKNSKVILALYVSLFVIYILILSSLEYSDNDTFSFYMIIMASFMVEAFKCSLFNLSYYYSNGSEYSIVKVVVSRLKTHLHFLSIKMSDFVLYNVIYTCLRLLPFILITIILSDGMYPIYFILAFSAVYLLKAFVGPMISYVLSIQMDIYLNDKELSRKEKELKMFQEIQELYPNVNVKVFQFLRTLYLFSYIILVMGVYVIVFQFVFEFFNWSKMMVYGVLVIAFINIFIYGLYLNNVERKQDYVLYKE